MPDHTTTSNETPAKYRKKPVEIEAVQWTGDNWLACHAFLGGSYWGENDATDDDHDLHIRTLEGIMDCPVGHWIIRGVKGEHYSCDPEIFALTYEPVTP